MLLDAAYPTFIQLDSHLGQKAPVRELVAAFHGS